MPHKTYSTRSLAAAVLVSFALVIAILLGTRFALDRTVTTAIETESIKRVHHLTAQIQRNFPELNRLAVHGLPNQSTRRRMEQQLVFAEGLVQLKVYGASGLLHYVHDRDLWLARGGERSNPELARSQESRAPVYALLDEKNAETGDTRLLYRAVEPLYTDTGKHFGYLEISFDNTRNAGIFRGGLDWMVFTLPLLIAAAYLFPTLGLLFFKNRHGRVEAEIQKLSRVDALTGLMNRAAFTTEASTFLETPAKLPMYHGLMMININQFRTLNATKGHEFGDAFLSHVAKNLKNILRKGDIVARFDGDEFVALLPNVLPDEMMSVGNRVRAQLRLPFRYGAEKHTCHARIGTHQVGPGESLDEAMQSADLAVTHAKQINTDQVVAYSPAFDKSQGRRRMIEAALQDAWPNNRAHLVFQPIVDASTLRIAGFEALMRLTTEAGEAISPVEFIPIAEQTGVIRELGRDALEHAMGVARSWPDDIFLAINLSPAQFSDDSLAEEVAWLIEGLDFPAERLEFEVTEGLLLDENPQVMAQFDAFKKMGISMAMDDFGTGFSSLSYLLSYDFDKLKIDRSFLVNFQDDPERQAKVLKSIIELAHQIGMKVTAEGVETQAQIEMLYRFGSDLLQGFHFSRPILAKDIPALLEAMRAGAA